jgi:cytochrome c556
MFGSLICAVLIAALAVAVPSGTARAAKNVTVFTRAMFDNALRLQERIGDITPGALRYEDIIETRVAAVSKTTEELR